MKAMAKDSLERTHERMDRTKIGYNETVICHVFIVKT